MAERGRRAASAKAVYVVDSSDEDEDNEEEDDEVVTRRPAKPAKAAAARKETQRKRKGKARMDDSDDSDDEDDSDEEDDEDEEDEVVGRKRTSKVGTAGSGKARRRVRSSDDEEFVVESPVKAARPAPSAPSVQRSTPVSKPAPAPAPAAAAPSPSPPPKRLEFTMPWESWTAVTSLDDVDDLPPVPITAVEVPATAASTSGATSASGSTSRPPAASASRPPAASASRPPSASTPRPPATGPSKAASAKSGPSKGGDANRDKPNTAPDHVLGAVRLLRQQHREAEEERHTRPAPELTASMLAVTEQSDTEVSDRIEELVVRTVLDILNGQGNQASSSAQNEGGKRATPDAGAARAHAHAGLNYSVPTRSNSSQLYLPELDRIVLRGDRSSRRLASVATARYDPRENEKARAVATPSHPLTSPMLPTSFSLGKPR